MTIAEKLQRFADVLAFSQLEGLKRNRVDCEANRANCKTRVVMGKKYAKVDVGGSQWSGRYMVDLVTGIIYGIKGYGKVNKRRSYGTLDAISEFDWSGYTARHIR